MNRTVVFLSGETMHPSAVRAAYANPRFIARASITAAESKIAPFFARALVDRAEAATIWGIAVEIDGDTPTSVTIATDEGRTIEASIPDELLVAGDPEAVLAAALYWELTPSYTVPLREAAGIAAPEAEGGWETPPLESSLAG